MSSAVRVLFPAVAVPLDNDAQLAQTTGDLKGLLTALGEDTEHPLADLARPDDIPPFVHVDRTPDRAAKAAAMSIFKRLDAIDPTALGAVSEDDEPPYLHFEPEAQVLFNEWWMELEVKVQTPEVQQRPAFAKHLYKYKKLMPAPALIFHLVGWAAGEPVGRVLALGGAGGSLGWLS